MLVSRAGCSNPQLLKQQRAGYGTRNLPIYQSLLGGPVLRKTQVPVSTSAVQWCLTVDKGASVVCEVAFPVQQ